MNGRVVALFVEEGEAVEAGQRLAVVEAMKMEHALTAPFAGVVRDLVATVGEQVEMGERIMRVEGAGEEAAAPWTARSLPLLARWLTGQPRPAVAVELAAYRVKLAFNRELRRAGGLLLSRYRWLAGSHGPRR